MKPATPSTLRTTCVTSLLPLLLLPALGMAATRTVTTLADATNPNDGVLSLREAIGASVNGDTINFSVAGTITLINGELLIGRSIAINGPALASLAVSGNNASRVFNISSNISVNISSLTISSGYLVGGEGGGIHNNGNNLTVSNCTFSGNVAGFGGGIFNGQGHNLTVNNCTFSGNSAQGTPIGGVGVGIFNAGTLTVNNSTFSRNSAFQLMGSSGGGGIFNSIASGGLNIINILNTIIADNTGAYDRDIYSAFAVISQGHNLIGDSGSSVGWVGSDLLGTTDSPLNPQLGPLMDNGGPTFTMALLPISAAIDAGDDVVLGSPYNLSTDQRGRARRTGDHVDIGAYEFGGMTRLVTTLTDSGGGSLRGALALAMDFDRILFAPVVRGTIRLTRANCSSTSP